jgi:hypothetical protein
MKAIFYSISMLLLLVSCSSSKDYLLRADEDKTFFDIIKRLNKRSTDEDATKALAEVYSRVQERHLKKIATYNASNELSKWTNW